MSTKSFPRRRESQDIKHEIPSCEGMRAWGDTVLLRAKARCLVIESAVLMDRGPGSSPGTGWFLRNRSSTFLRLAPASQALLFIW